MNHKCFAKGTGTFVISRKGVNLQIATLKLNYINVFYAEYSINYQVRIYN